MVNLVGKLLLPRSLNEPMFVMSRQSTLSNTICIRDFVDLVVSDPSREDNQNYVEIRADVNIFEENDFFSDDIVVEPIRTRIRAYLSRGNRNQYCPNAFFYAEGRFSATIAPDNALEMNIQALSLMRCVFLRVISLRVISLRVISLRVISLVISVSV